MKLTVKTLPPKQLQKMQLSAAYHDGFSAACDALLKVFSAAEHAAIRDIISTVDHIQGDPRMVRLLRKELRSKALKRRNPSAARSTRR
jgi:hypothetical protein